jgi:hypothetical protein
MCAEPPAPDDPLERVLLRQEEEPAPQFSRAVDVLAQDFSAREQLIGRYASEPDARVRSRIRSLLSFIPTADVAAFGLRLGSDKDPAMRRDGFEMLHAIQASSREARNLLLDALAVEQDPKALSAAIVSLSPSGADAPQEASRVLERLDRLAEHPSPEVRAEILLARARWVGSERSEEIILSGITDAQPDVREAAMDALAERSVRSDRVKAALLKIAIVESDRPTERRRAVAALEDFTLTAQEHAALAELRDRLFTSP